MTFRPLGWKDIETCCASITQQVNNSNIHFNALIGLSRGGLVPSTILAHQLGIREVLVHGYHSYDENTNTRDPDNSHGFMYQDVVYDLKKGLSGKHILIVDDLCDAGVTMQGLTRRLYKKFHKGAVNFSTATLFCKQRSIFKPNYVGEYCGDEWLVFPWEVHK